ncbi:MAG: GntR family transcriptional regulator [Clostridium sp.]|uniref:GntR family transcriptional regulator n=1 Tax=Clostridium sp. TaxID=1506 RepID=UPI001ECFC471|nr:GntR family transcriptional regulator [Clostridium sp.]MBS5885649.1 GntR family transcriptional regulator [Clostridium sp.]MDU7149579.1 GntR family transcriptional regulator [Clostridium sp.]MDU7242883.1 GntR family transcriptional regulator [Clostridium sp.]
MANPIYIEIKNRIMEEIADKPASSPISSERDMAIKYGASRMTVRKAINDLVTEGVLYRDKNKGTYVSDRKLLKKNTSTEILENQDSIDYVILYFKVKKTEQCDKEIGDIMKLSNDDLVLRIVRLNQKEGCPLSAEEIYFNTEFVNNEDINNLPKLLNLTQLLTEGTMTQKFIPIIVPSQYSNILHLKLTTPIIMVETLISNRKGHPLIFIRTFNNPNEKVIEITS